MERKDKEKGRASVGNMNHGRGLLVYVKWILVWQEVHTLCIGNGHACTFSIASFPGQSGGWPGIIHHMIDI